MNWGINMKVTKMTKEDFDNGETWVSLMKRNALALKKGMR